MVFLVSSSTPYLLSLFEDMFNWTIFVALGNVVFSQTEFPSDRYFISTVENL